MIKRTNVENIKLNHLIKYVIKHIPYYRDKDYKKIEDFPIIKKEIIKGDYFSFLSDELGEKAGLIEILESDFNIEKYVIEKKYKSDIFIEWTTGTSGIPFKCIKTAQERKNISLSMWKRRMKVDSCISPAKFLPMIHTGISPFPYDIRDYSFENLSAMYRYIGDREITCIHTSPTLIERHLSQPYSEQIVFPKTLKYIESTGRYLEEYVKLMAENRFGAKVINMYGTIETWGIAATCKNERMHINSDNVYVELLDEQDNVINECGKSGMIVVTALNQYMMPFIRYKTNDYGMYLGEVCLCGQKSMQLELCKCRESQYIIVGDKKISGEEFVRKVLRRVEFEKVFQDISQIMLQEKSRDEYILFLNRLSDSGKFEKLFSRYLQEELKKKVNILFTYITEKEFEKLNPKSYIFVRK